MPSPRALPPVGVVSEALGLGCLFGLLHAIAETTLLGWSGIHPSLLDLAILTVVSISFASVPALLTALVVTVPGLRGVLGNTESPFTFRRLAWHAVVAVYMLVFLRTIYYWSGWNTLLWALAAVPFLAFAASAVVRKGQRALVSVCATTLVVAALCSLQIIHAAQMNWSESQIRSTWQVGLAMCLLAVLLLIAAGRKTPAGSPFEPISKSAAPLAVLTAAWLVLWAAPRLPVEPLFRSGVRTGADASRPNILLVVLDTVRADRLDLFGYERQTMPHLRRFAEQECQFAGRMFTAAPWTVPSHASMFTGLYPSAHGAHHPFVHDETPPLVAYSLPEDKVTLAEIMDGLGYQTAGIVGNFGAMSEFGMSRGFAEYDPAPSQARRGSEVVWLYRFQLSFVPPLGELIREALPDALQPKSVLFSLRQPPYRRAREITGQAQQWLDRNGHRPFFLFLNYFDAHFPYLPLPEDDQRFAPRPPGDDWRGFPEDRYLARTRGVGEFTDQEKEFLIGQYDTELVGLDREFGRLIDYLRENGFLENTVVLVTTDHGESQFEHGLLDHGNSLYQPEIGGFLLVKAPESVGPINPSPQMQFVDFLPTILTILGEPVPPEVQGSPWGAGRDYVLSELFCKPGVLHDPGEWPDYFKRDRVAVVIDNLKLIRSSHGPDEVFDLAADPDELHPLTNPDPEFLRRAEEVIAKRNERLVEGLSGDPEDKKLLDKLRSLGYVQ